MNSEQITDTTASGQSELTDGLGMYNIIGINGNGECYTHDTKNARELMMT